MTTHKGKPSGLNKGGGTGTPSDFKPGDLRNDEKLTQKYTDDDKKISDGVRSRKPNRNTNKEDATNAHGYKN